jgi:hypothetical protein
VADAANDQKTVERCDELVGGAISHSGFRPIGDRAGLTRDAPVGAHARKGLVLGSR